MADPEQELREIAQKHLLYGNPSDGIIDMAHIKEALREAYNLGAQRKEAAAQLPAPPAAKEGQ